MSTIQPKEFWEAYKGQLSKLPPAEAAAAYAGNRSWTPLAVEAADKAMRQLGLQFSHEYYRLDAMGYETLGTHNWMLRVAFEHENTDQWGDELCKLSHLVADLRVLVFYWNFKEGTPTDELDRRFAKLKEQLGRNIGQWLFIIGPLSVSFGETFPYVAYAYDGNRLEQVEDDGSLNPLHWR